MDILSWALLLIGMLKMDFEITIGSAKLKGVESVAVTSSVDALSDQCSIAVPSMYLNKSYNVEKKVKRGDTVTVKLGYSGNLHTEFVGYVRSIKPNTPLVIECEDAIHLFRKPVGDAHLLKTDVGAILAYVLKEVNKQSSEKIALVSNISGIQFDKFTIIHANGFEVLEKLKSECGIAIYCRVNKAGKPELHAHLAYTEKRGTVSYDFARNVETSDDLQYVSKDDIRVKAKVIGRTKNGATIEVEVGDSGGDLRTFQRPNISDKDTLEKIGKEQLKKLTYDGYKGTLKSWLIPVVEVGYSAKIADKEYPERQGTYFVNSVKTEFSASGGRRTVALGVKLS